MFEFIFYSIPGALIVIVGLLIWKKEMISLIRRSHYRGVCETDKKAYTSLMGKGFILVGC